MKCTRDEDDLERALRRALALTEAQRAEMQAAAAQRLAERFSRSRMISEVAALYDEVARERMALR